MRRRLRFRTCRHWLAVVVILGVMGLSAVGAQAALGNAVWTGASTSSGWSNASNWTGTPPAANGSAGTLSFPTLGTCSTCYSSNDNLSNVSVTGLVLSNTSGAYQISGDSFEVGTGGITHAPGGGSGDSVKAPIDLSGGSQTWVVGSTVNGYNSFTVQGGITGTSALTLSMPRGDLFIDSDMEVGPITSNGPGGLHIGGPPGGTPGSVNATDGKSLTINGGSLVANPSSTSGPLSMNSGTLLLGTNPLNNGTTTLDVKGTATLSSSTTTQTFINGNGSTPGTDFSQLSATGNITLGGKLVLGQGGQGSSNGPCVALNPGDVATLVTTTGTLSGTFANAPDGTILTMAPCQQSAPAEVEIQYTSSSATATVIGTLTTPNPSTASPNGGGRLLRLGGRLSVIRGWVAVKERCQSSVLCRGSFSLMATVRVGKRKKFASVRCVSASFRVQADRAATVRVRLTARCVRLLRHHPHHRLIVLYISGSQTGQAGQAGQRKRITLVLEPPKRRKRRPPH